MSILSLKKIEVCFYFSSILKFLLMENSMVNPFVLLLYAFIFPPCISTISFVIDKPRPLIFLDLSVVNSGSNILLIFSLSTPVPLSVHLK